MKKNKGITLIALVITIIVLLILAGVSINAIIGDNGIATRAKDASTKTEIAKEVEQVELARTNILLDKQVNNDETDISVEELQNKMDLNAGMDVTEVYFEDDMLIVKYIKTNRIYEVNPKFGYAVDWDKAIADAKKHSEQDALNPDIGIGTDGKPVNLDNWYYYEEDGEITLGKMPYEQSGVYGGNTTEIGYIGNIVNGKIEGTIPQYIIIDGTAYPIVNLDATFKGYSDLEVAPEIPSTVKQMHGTFYGCTSLQKTPEFPAKLESLGDYGSVSVAHFTGAFYGCTNLQTVSKLPATLITMDYAFAQCSSLKGTLSINSFASATYCLQNAAINGDILYLTAPEMINGSYTINYLEDMIEDAGENSNIEIK